MWGIKHQENLNRLGNNVDGVSPLSLSLTGTPGNRDYFNDIIFLNRTGNAANSQTWSQQRGENQGGFRSNSVTGLNSKQLATVNIFVPLPKGPKFFGVFADAGYFKEFKNSVGSSYELSSGAICWNAGVGIKLGEVFGIYVPLIHSTDLAANPVNSWNQNIRINANFSWKIGSVLKNSL
jgi:hypothetical protein